MTLTRSFWHGCRPQRDYAPAGLLFKNFRSLAYWVRPVTACAFLDLWAVRITSNCGKVSICPHKVMGYHGAFEFDWFDWQHVSQILVQSSRKHGLVTVGECQDGTFSWVFCSATTEARALEHDDVTFVADRIASQNACRDLTGVYFISNGRGAVKIGLSNRRMHERLTTLQLHNPDPLTVVAVIPDACPEALEHRLHLDFAERRIRNEWFCLTDDEARQIAQDNGGFSLSGCVVDTK